MIKKWKLFSNIRMNELGQYLRGTESVKQMYLILNMIYMPPIYRIYRIYRIPTASVVEYFYHYSFVIIYFQFPLFVLLKNEIQGNICKKDAKLFQGCKSSNVIIMNKIKTNKQNHIAWLLKVSATLIKEKKSLRIFVPFLL